MTTPPSINVLRSGLKMLAKDNKDDAMIADFLLQVEERLGQMKDVGDKLDSAMGCGCGIEGPCCSCQAVSEDWEKVSS